MREPLIVKAVRYFFSYLRFSFFPSEATFLRYHWDHFANFKRVKPMDTMDHFLFDIGMYHQSLLLDVDLPWTKRRLYKRFQYAVENPATRPRVIAFLEAKPFPREQLSALCEILRIAEPPSVISVPANALEQPPSVISVPPPACDDLPQNADPPNINARTFVVAAELTMEVEGKTAEFDAMSCDVLALATFIKDKFGIQQLPGNFKDHKGYSYRKTLKDKSQSKKGQLKTCFRQIIDHPEVFGEAIRRLAQQALKEEFD